MWAEESQVTVQQIDCPCHECPFRRTSVPGWLGGASPDEYRGLAHSDERVMCHVYQNVQCAGAAIYRTHVAKMPRDPSALLLPADKVNVFSDAREFLAHHQRWFTKHGNVDGFAEALAEVVAKKILHDAGSETDETEA